MFCGQGAEQSAADASLCDGGGHARPEEPTTLSRGERSQLVRVLPQLPTREAAGALPLTYVHTYTREIRSGNSVYSYIFQAEWSSSVSNAHLHIKTQFLKPEKSIEKMDGALLGADECRKRDRRIDGNS